MLQAFDVHRLVQAIAQRLIDQRMVGQLALAHEVLGTGDLVGKHDRQQIFRAQALQWRRNLFARAEPWQRQRGRRGPAPARRKHRRVEHRLNEQGTNAVRMQITRDLFEREAVTRRQRKHDGIFGGRCLQLEIEFATEALA